MMPLGQIEWIVCVGVCVDGVLSGHPPDVVRQMDLGSFMPPCFGITHFDCARQRRPPGMRTSMQNVLQSASKLFELCERACQERRSSSAPQRDMPPHAQTAPLAYALKMRIDCSHAVSAP